MNEIYEKFAKLICEQSLAVQPGEKVLIEITGIEDGLAAALMRAVYEAGGQPFYNQLRDSLQSVWISGAGADAMAMQSAWDVRRMEEMDAYVSLRISSNPFDMSAVPKEQSQMYRTYYERPVHFDTRIPHTRWLVTSLPSAAMAQAAGMATAELEKFYYRCCCIDYRRFAQRMEPLAKLMARTDRVRITGADVDLRFSIKDTGVCVCRGNRNLPAGEVFTAPVIDSVEGCIRYNTPSMYSGQLYSGICLEFSKGRIEKASCQQGSQSGLEEIFQIDPGARYIGEFALGTNPFVDRIVGDILFDEKAASTFHFTPGNSYQSCGNGNSSKIHWDLIYRMEPAFGGGEIWFDNVLIQKDGLYLPEELQPLNPESLRAELAL